MIDGVEYGYAFEAITEGKTTWMLVMTFASLPGGRSVSPDRPKAGWVSVIRSDDHGRTWRFIKNLNSTFRAPLNESSFIRYQDGFLVACRSYENAQPVVVTDADFNVRRQVDLVAQYDFVAKGMGRPRVFEKDGRVYIIARTTPKPRSAAPAPGREATVTAAAVERMRLSLMRLNPQTLQIEKHVVLRQCRQSAGH